VSGERSAAIVLAGGGSARMGTPKALLDWHGSTLVRRAVGLVARVVDGPVVVVRAAGQTLPALPPGTEIVDDAHAARGPLEGMAAGLRAIGDRAEIVFVTGVDAPLLHPALVRHVVASLRPGDDVALPVAGGFAQPLAAAYRTATIAPLIDALLADNSLGTRPLMQRCRVRRLDEAALLADCGLAAHDPGLDSLVNLNEPAEYAAAHARPEPLVTVEGRGTIRAATLARAGLGAAIVDGRRTTDPQEPLAAGDALRPAGSEP
jgi:molybdopterin-guanine dinucleotide biosynthesis protein A